MTSAYTVLILRGYNHKNFPVFTNSDGHAIECVWNDGRYRAMTHGYAFYTDDISEGKIFMHTEENVKVTADVFYSDNIPTTINQIMMGHHDTGSGIQGYIPRVGSSVCDTGLFQAVRVERMCVERRGNPLTLSDYPHDEGAEIHNRGYSVQERSESSISLGYPTGVVWGLFW